MPAFFRRHKMSCTILLIVLALILYVVVYVLVYNHQKWKIVRPLEAVLAEKCSQDEFYIQHIEVTDKHGELQIWEIHVVVSLEMQNSPSFLERCYDVSEIISEYAKQHPDQFTLNREDGFYLSFDCGEYYINQFSTLRFSNRFFYDTEWEQYYDDLVNMTIRPVNGLKGISVYDKVLRLDIDCIISSYEEDVVEEVSKMPNLKYIDIGIGDDLSIEEKKKYASKFYEYGIRSSLWESLYG